MITGRVLEQESGQPLEYTNIVLFSLPDSGQVTGTVTDRSGEFALTNIPSGSYYLDILFLGYEKRRIAVVVDGPQFLGDILLSPSAVLLGDVIVQGERAPLTYEIDKKVLDVAQMSATISGTAAEVLENLPSVQVDIEGNVSLRGSTNFTVLIDGRPTVLDAQDVLQQIPASAIGRIEIITNPSAKYDPEGTAGVINIIMARGRERGLSGLVSGNVGLRDKYGGDALMEYREDKMTVMAGGDHNHRFFAGTELEEHSTTFQNITTNTRTNGNSRRGRMSWGLRGGVEYTPSPVTTWSLGLRHGRRSHEQGSTLNYLQWTDPLGPGTARTNTTHRQRSGEFTSITLGLLRKFGLSGHELKADLQFGFDRSDEFTHSELLGSTVLNGRKTTEKGPETEFEGRLEYVLPLGIHSRFEAGYHGESESSGEQTGLQEYDSASGAYQSLDQFSHDVRYATNEHAFFTLYGGEAGPFGFQTGLRAEYTQRNIRINETAQEFVIDRWDFFPTLHASYSFGGAHQILASYTRRINRPRGWELEPFDTWMDANNVRRGNPSLTPEYIDSYEVGGQTVFGGISLSAELYRTVTHNRIEDVRTVYTEDATLRRPYNVGMDYSFGTEVLVNTDIVRGWNINLIGNLYRFQIEGMILGERFSRSSTNWSARFNSTVKLGSTQFQWNTRIHSPTVSSQGRREGFVSVDLALRQDLLNRQLAVIAQVWDLFGSERREFSSSGEGFSLYSRSDRESPVFMLTLRYTLGGYRSDERSGRNGEDGGGGDGDEF
ncbi:MAG: TonB-dependent receptor [Bacteroidia bacterium]|nr:MAG: TonB-dependent receptor [Bacteroidia bacterium]